MQDKDYINRSIELAKLGGKAVRPNPQVGAVIVYNDRIIGEGYHMEFGKNHAEVNAINSVAAADKQFLDQCTMYVSLEPCCHFGNTPPCTDLIIKNKIPRVCISEIDPTEKVNRKGIHTLENNGIEVVLINPSTFDSLAEFRVNQVKKRPFVQLKFAKSKDNFIGKKDEQIWFSNDTSNIFTHKLRSYTDAILIGTNTAIIDNPSLTLRNYPGKNPLRIVLDRDNRIPLTHTLLSDSLPTWIVTAKKRDRLSRHKQQILIDFSDENLVENLMKQLFDLNINHLMVEGGASLIKSFVKSNIWDEAVIIDTPKILSSGIKAINIHGNLRTTYQLEGDKISIIENIKLST